MPSLKTPLIQSSTLSQRNNCEIWLKMESAQPAGSFKHRSIGEACKQYAKQGAKRFISSSGGNAGIAVAYMGQELNLPVTVIVPKTTSKRAIELMQNQQAEVIVHGETWAESDQLAQSRIDSENIYIPPFDHPYLWNGVAQIIDEVIADGLTPSAVVLSVGGGSLLSGISQGLIKHQLNIPIYAIETEGTASLNTAMKTGQHITLEQVTGIATTLAAKQVCANAFAVSQQRKVIGLTVSDHTAVAACIQFLDDHRTLVEPACGATLSVLYDQKIRFAQTDKILVIVCSGATTSVEQLHGYAQTL
ncbi:pyridoxal-phosphate dependent enzyme [Acinetobacter sp. MD2(2019)]|uniref:pyridoxal-phosphate dependent enzyme n=1 Tax=Acinetobacter sp. MD2(2019) TaxID=2605273 RepID=UPI002D1F2B6E|nr:pyridoxal-phosphate dependent enzyme [Acinetobacter sp. MD2(2019)]MEB3754922.1 pyridoxal-phosphate dependent enzyme [Acinetobacter sp. MD2(2019)]